MRGCPERPGERAHSSQSSLFVIDAAAGTGYRGQVPVPVCELGDGGKDSIARCGQIRHTAGRGSTRSVASSTIRRSSTAFRCWSRGRLPPPHENRRRWTDKVVAAGLRYRSMAGTASELHSHAPY